MWWGWKQNSNFVGEIFQIRELKDLSNRVTLVSHRATRFALIYVSDSDSVSLLLMLCFSACHTATTDHTAVPKFIILSDSHLFLCFMILIFIYKYM